MAKRFNLTTVRVSAKTKAGKTISVGTAEHVRVRINQEGVVGRSAGQKMPDEIVDGVIGVTGEIERGQIDFNPQKYLINKNGENPYFDLTGTEKVTGKTFKVFNCKLIGETGVDIALSDYGKDNIPFTACDYDFAGDE